MFFNRVKGKCQVVDLNIFRKSKEMKKSILTLTLALLMLPVFGCLESLVRKANPKQDIKNALVKLQDAYAKEDVDGILAIYSEDYEGGQGEEKSQIAEFLSGMKDQGYLADTEVVLDDVVIEVDGDTATADFVTYSGDWGQADYKTTFRKKGSTWKIIAGEQSY